MVNYAMEHSNLKASEVASHIVQLARKRWKAKDVFIDD